MVKHRKMFRPRKWGERIVQYKVVPILIGTLGIILSSNAKNVHPWYNLNNPNNGIAEN